MQLLARRNENFQLPWTVFGKDKLKTLHRIIHYLYSGFTWPSYEFNIPKEFYSVFLYVYYRCSCFSYPFCEVMILIQVLLSRPVSSGVTRPSYKFIVLIFRCYSPLLWVYYLIHVSLNPFMSLLSLFRFYLAFLWVQVSLSLFVNSLSLFRFHSASLWVHYPYLGFSKPFYKFRFTQPSYEFIIPYPDFVQLPVTSGFT